MKQEKVYKEINHLWWLLRCVYAGAFIGSGWDKYAQLLINWSARSIPLWGISQEYILMIRAGIEISIGILLCTRFVKVGAYAAAVWLLISALYSVMIPDHVDTALRYAVIALGAYTLARLTMLKKELISV